jgi:phosphatidylinositol alpha-mannosyltransferase
VRILHIDPDDIDNPMSGGGPVRTYEIYRRLAARHEITVLTPTFAGSTAEKTRDGVRFVRLGRKVRNHGSSHHITFFFSLPAAVRRFEYDLLVEDFMPPMAATFTPFFTRKPLIASVQWFFGRTLAQQYKLPFHVGERYGVRLYDRFVVLTEAMKAHIESLNRRADCVVIPSGVDETLRRTEIRAGDFVLYLGRVDFEQKGVDMLLEAYARIPPLERRPLVIAGHGFEWERFDARVAQLQLQPWVKRVGKVDAAERRRLLEGCRFFVVPSRDETFGMVIAEACAAGKPVVLFDHPPMNEVAAPGACEMVPPWDVAAYGAAMQRLSKSEDAELVRRGEACRSWAERYQWDHLARQQEQYYEKVVEASRCRAS